MKNIRSRKNEAGSTIAASWEDDDGRDVFVLALEDNGFIAHVTGRKRPAPPVTAKAHPPLQLWALSWELVDEPPEPPLAAMGFDPNQPRDDHGRWTDTGASDTSGDGSSAPAAPVAPGTHRHHMRHGLVPAPTAREASGDGEHQGGRVVRVADTAPGALAPERSQPSALSSPGAGQSEPSAAPQPAPTSTGPTQVAQPNGGGTAAPTDHPAGPPTTTPKVMDDAAWIAQLDSRVPRALPQYRHGVDEAAYHEFLVALAKAGLTPLEQICLAEYFLGEGGVKKDPTSTAVGGLLEGTLKPLRDSGLYPELGTDSDPIKPTAARMPIYYTIVINRQLKKIGGLEGLSRIKDPYLAIAAMYPIMHFANIGVSVIMRSAIFSVLRQHPDAASAAGLGDPVAWLIDVEGKDAEASAKAIFDAYVNLANNDKYRDILNSAQWDSYESYIKEYLRGRHKTGNCSPGWL